MATVRRPAAARRWRPIPRRIVAIELLAAAQGVDLRRPLATSAPLAARMALIRADVPFWDRDRAFAPDLAAIRSASSAATSSLSLRSISGGLSCTATIPINSPQRPARLAPRRPRHPRAARHRAHREELAHRSRAADDPEQPRSRGRRESARSSSSTAASAAPRATGSASTRSSRRCASSATTSRC